MKRLAMLLVLLAGCSTRPVADVLDWANRPRGVGGRGRGGVAPGDAAVMVPPGDPGQPPPLGPDPLGEPPPPAPPPLGTP